MSNTPFSLSLRMDIYQYFVLFPSSIFNQKKNITDRTESPTVLLHFAIAFFTRRYVLEIPPRCC